MINTTSLSRELSARVRAGLDRKRWTQAELARQAGITEKHISQVLTGQASASVVLWDQLLALTDAPPVRPSSDSHLAVTVTPESARRYVLIDLQGCAWVVRWEDGHPHWHVADALTRSAVIGLLDRMSGEQS